MKNRVLSLALGSMLGLGAAFAAQAPATAPDASQAPAAAANADQSQPQQHRAHRRAANPDRQVAMLTKRLKLTTDQQNQIRPILVDRQQQMADILKDNKLSRDDRHSKIVAVREDSKNKIEAVLNADQKQNYEQMLERHHQHRKQAQKG